MNSKWLSLAPLSLLSVSYWLRDRFLYNRVPRSVSDVSATQWKTLVCLTPFWVFLQWSLSEQILHGQLPFALFTTTATTCVNHYYILGALNDTFDQTRQQMKGLVFSLVIQYLWTTTRVIVYAREEC